MAKTARLAIAALGLAVACSGSPGMPGASAPERQPASAHGIREERQREVRRAAGEQLRRAMMQVGTGWQRGRLISFCSEGRCTRGPDAEPRSYRGVDEDLVVFVIGARPSAGRVEVRRPSGRVIDERTLAPSTTMAYALPPSSGRLVLSFTATWDEREARWVFGLRRR